MLCRIVIFVIVFLHSVSGLSRRCYECRSRGVLGDCRDPFRFNETTTSFAETGVSTTPCPSGWCTKFIEGISGPADEYGTATERGCLQLPPNDEEERCAKIQWNSKPTFICFCRGDLCNAAQAVAQQNYLFYLTSIIIIPAIILSLLPS